MKKLFFLLALTITSALSYAQVYQLTWSNGEVLYGIAVDDFDSVNYVLGDDIDMSRVHIFNRNNINRVVHDTMYITKYVYDTIYAAPPVKSVGVFSVGSNKKVTFSPGNLQYQASSNTWRFAENQYDYIGYNNSNANKSYRGWIDVFGYGTSGWSGSGVTYYQPWDTQYFSGKVGGYFNQDLQGHYENADWGIFNKISNGGNATNKWRTLSQNEWDYLLINYKWTIVKVAGTQGLMIIPDDFQCPLSINIQYPSSRVVINGSDKYYSFSTYNMTNLTLEQFTKLQDAGVVFLPCGGYRYGSVGMMNVGVFGNYWTSTAGKNIWFTPSVLYSKSGAERWAGLQVRLVMDVE